MISAANSIRLMSACSYPLASNAVSGTYTAFDRLLQRDERSIYAAALSLTGTSRDAEQVLSEVLAFFAGSKDLSEQNLPPFTDVVREAIYSCGKILEGRAYCELCVSNDTDSQGQGYTEERRLGGAIRNTLVKLPFEYRKVFVLRDVLGLSIGDTCEVLAISLEDCRARLGRARLMLRRSLLRDQVQIQATNAINAGEDCGIKPEVFV